MRFILYMIFLSIFAMVVWNDTSLFKAVVGFGCLAIWLIASLFAFGENPVFGLLVLFGAPLSLIGIVKIWDSYEEPPSKAKKRHIEINDGIVKNGGDPWEWDDLTIEEYHAIVRQREEKRKNNLFTKMFKRNRSVK